MKKHTRSFTALGCAVAALAAAGFGFSKWSSDIALTGNVNAKGNWDVAIESASVKSISTGTSVDGTLTEIAPTIDVVVYDVYADYCTDFNPSWKEYRVHIDDTKPRTITLTQEEFEEYTYRCFVSGSVMAGYDFYESGLRGSNIQYLMNLNETAAEIGFEGGRVYADSDDDSYDGAYLGTAIGEHLASPNKNPWGIQIVYNDVASFFETASAQTYYAAEIAEDGQSARFADVSLELPGAWAEYEVTISNKGTADANLKDYLIDFETKSSLLTFDAPDLDDTVLKSGETCTFTFVAAVADTDEPVLNEEGTVVVRLSYEQDAVEPAPEASHTHH